MGGRVSIRSLSEHRWSLVREDRSDIAMTAADALAILGDRMPVIAWDDSGPGGELVFPINSRTAVLLRDQLNDELQAAAEACPAESFPEPGAPDVDADDFAEPAGGEGARVAAEETAWEAQIRAAATAIPRTLDPAEVDHHRYGGWRSGDRFVVNDPDDVARNAAALHLWPTWGGKASGHVITRCDVHHTGHDTSAGLLIDCDGLPRPIVVSPRVLSACARKVGA